MNWVVVGQINDVLAVSVAIIGVFAMCAILVSGLVLFDGETEHEKLWWGTFFSSIAVLIGLNFYMESDLNGIAEKFEKSYSITDVVISGDTVFYSDSGYDFAGTFQVAEKDSDIIARIVSPTRVDTK